MNTFVVYPGKFQPFHMNHYKVYRHLREVFEKYDIFIATSDAKLNEHHPFSFDEKKQIIQELFDINSNFIKKVASPYHPEEITSLNKNSRLIVVVSNKDAERLSNSPYYSRYTTDGECNKPCSVSGYYYVAPEFDASLGSAVISGTLIRNLFRTVKDIVVLRKLFYNLYYNDKDSTFNKFVEKLYVPQMIRHVSEELVKDAKSRLLLEKISSTIAIPADDGPATWYASQQEYEREVKYIIDKLGYIIADYIADKGPRSKKTYDMKQDALPYATFYQKGVQSDYPVSEPDKIYKAFIDAVAETSGYEIVKYLGLNFEVDKK